MKRQQFARCTWGRIGLAAAVVAVMAGVAPAQILLSENFDGLAGSLGSSVNERVGLSNTTLSVNHPTYGSTLAVPNAFTHTAPGWSVNNTTYDAYTASIGNVGVPLAGTPEYGVDEWEGWSFARKDFWVDVAGDQNRSQFALGSGNVAVADGDEYDDLRKAPGDPAGASIETQGFMNTEMKTANINVAAYQGQTLTFAFDSSWQAEAHGNSNSNPVYNSTDNQSVVISASFDGAPVGDDAFLAFWDSLAGSGIMKPDNTNETLSYSLPIPAGKTNVQLKLGYFNAGNNWWWAVDNLTLKAPDNSTVWSEDFEGVTLGPSVNERKQPGAHVTRVQTDPNSSPVANAFTHTAPAGWNVDNSGGLPGIGDPAQGTEEWEGWSFTTPSFWQFVDSDGRQNFTKGTGVVAIADPDSWDNLGDPESLGTFNTLLVTPAINITGVGAGNLKLAFDSSWRPEDTQTAIIEASYDGGAFTEVLRWESVAGPNFHDNNVDESVLLSLSNSGGNTSVRFRWGVVNATDDWWWGLDNIVVSAVPEPGSALLVSLAMMGLTLVGGRRRS